MKINKYTLLLGLTLSICSVQIQAQEGVELSGDIVQYLLPGASFYSALKYTQDDKPGWQYVKSLGATVVLTHVIKFGIDKERPNGGSLSFPSGHTAAAFSGAAFLERRHGWKVGVPAYLLASYVGWTRIHANKHDFYDVVGGAIIGWGFSYIFTEKFVGENYRLNLDIGSSSASLNFELQF